jgi:transposase-like protein
MVASFGQWHDAAPRRAKTNRLPLVGGNLNNVIEADHGKLKQLIRPVRGFKTLKNRTLIAACCWS